MEKHDAFKLASTQTRAGGYAGTAIIGKKLKPKTWPKLTDLSKTIVSAILDKTTFSALVRKAQAAKLPGLTGKYWPPHLLRFFTPGFSHITLPGNITMDKLGLSLLLDMGEGARELEMLGITPANAEIEIPRMCGLVNNLASRVGASLHITASQLVVCACESSRRNGLKETTGAICRRRGL